MNNIKLLCLGDSLTEGYNINKETRWTNLLKRETEIDAINAGVSGDTTSGMLARCERLLVHHKPSHILILGGTNDLYFGLKDEFILSNIHAIRRQSSYYKVQPIVGIPTSSMNLNELNMVHENYSECIRSFQSRLIRYCEEEHQVYINFSKNMTSEYFLEDGIHPNKNGQNIMMQNVRSTLTQFV